MPGSSQSSIALFLVLQFCGVASSWADHDEYLQRLDAFTSSPDPVLEDGIAYNEVFSIDLNNSFEEMIQSSTFFKYYAVLDFVNYPDGIFGDSMDRLFVSNDLSLRTR